MNTMSLHILTKLTSQKEGGGLENANRADEGGMGVEEKLKIYDKGGRGLGKC